MKEKLLLIISFLLYLIPLFSQDSVYTHRIIRDLSSPNFHGRGYVKNGDKKASKYIIKELKSIGINSMSASYIQSFSLNVNTFPSKMEVKIEGNHLLPGKDFLVSPNSKGIKGSFQLYRITKNELENPGPLLKNKHQNKLIVLDSTGINNISIKEFYERILFSNVLGATGIIEIVKKIPMFGISTTLSDFTVLHIQKNAFPSSKEKIEINIINNYLTNYNTQNIAGIIKGKTDTCIVFSAHYDHLGTLGKSTYFPGANDNASGVSMLLNLARYYSSTKSTNHYSYAFLFFGAEEAGLVGSLFYTQHPLFPLSKIKFLINLDVIGSGEKGIQVVNAPEFPKYFETIKSINDKKKYFTSVIRRAAVPNSDQYFFYKQGVECFFIFTLGDYKEYHNIYDKSDLVPLTKYKELYNLLIDFTSTIH